MTRIVIVEDSDDLRALYAEVLSQRGWRVESYRSVRDGRLALHAPPDLLVTDVQLPDGSGLDLVRAARALAGADLPILVLSGRDEEQQVLAGFDAGADDYLTKPVRPAELVAKCLVLMNRARPGSARYREQRRAPLPGADLPGGPGQAFGRYCIEGVLGQGGGGVVYAARDVVAHLDVALKVLGLDACVEAERRRFLRETYTLSLVRHPHVVRVLDVASQEGRFYYAMEREEGPTLARHVGERGPLTPTEAVALLHALASALDALAGADIVHRDIKPLNVVLRAGRPGDPVLLDFGLAKRPFDRTLTVGPEFRGTPGFAAPEAIRGRAVDQRADQFSLGLSVRYALLGEDAFPDLEGLALLQALANDPVPLPASIPPDLRQVLARMTHLHPDRRYPTSAALVQDAERLRVAARACVA